MNFLINLMLTLPMMGVALLARRLERGWCSPGALFALVWWLLFSIPVLLAPEEYVSLAALGFILLAVLAVLLGSLLASAICATNEVSSYQGDLCFREGRLRVALFVSIVIGIFFTPTVLWAEGFGFGQVFQLDQLAEIILHFAVGRYQETYQDPLISRPMLVCVYLAPLLGGMYLGTCRRSSWRRTILGFAALLPALLITILRSEKWPFVLVIGLFVSSRLVWRISARLSFSFNLKRLISGLLGGVLCAAVFVGSLFGRLDEGSRIDGFSLVLGKIGGYLFAYVTAFSKWFDGSWHEFLFNLGSLGFGANSLPGAADFIGVKQRLIGLYSREEDIVFLAGGDQSNIYTFFRLLIMDFSIPGAILVLFVVGIVVKFAFINIRSWHGVGIYTIFVACLLLSFNHLVIGSNTVLSAFVLYGIFLAFTVRQEKSTLMVPGNHCGG